MVSLLRRSVLSLAVAALAVVAVCGGATNVRAGDLPLRIVASVPLPGQSTRFDYESLDPKTHLLFIAHLAAGEVVVFDTAANGVVATIPNVKAAHGVLAVPELGRVYVTATGTNDVAVIDERTLKIIARIPGGTYPDGMAFDAADHKLYVSDEHGDTDTVIDTSRDARVATIALGGDVGNTQYDARTRRMYVNVQTRGDLVAVDPQRDRIVGRFPIPGCASNHGLQLDDAHRRAYIACEDNARLAVFDLTSFRETAIVSVGDNPDVLAYDVARSTLYVAAESGTVSMLSADAKGLTKIGEAVLGKNAHIVAVDQRSHLVYFPILGDNGPTMLVMQPHAWP